MRACVYACVSLCQCPCPSQSESELRCVCERERISLSVLVCCVQRGEGGGFRTSNIGITLSLQAFALRVEVELRLGQTPVEFASLLLAPRAQCRGVGVTGAHPFIYGCLFGFGVRCVSFLLLAQWLLIERGQCDGTTRTPSGNLNKITHQATCHERFIV